MRIRPPNRRTVQALRRHNELVERLIVDGMPRGEAVDAAFEQMRDNGKGD